MNKLITFGIVGTHFDTHHCTWSNTMIHAGYCLCRQETKASLDMTLKLIKRGLHEFHHIELADYVSDTYYDGAPAGFAMRNEHVADACHHTCLKHAKRSRLDPIVTDTRAALPTDH